MNLIRIGNTVINIDNVTSIDVDPYREGVRARVGVNFIAGNKEEYDLILERGDAAIMQDWLRRNAHDAQDWRSERAEEE